MDFLSTFNNLTLHSFSSPTQQAIKRQNILIHQFEDTDDPVELAVIYQLYLATGGDIRYLELDKRDKNLIKQMADIYRTNIGYIGYESI